MSLIKVNFAVYLMLIYLIYGDISEASITDIIDSHQAWKYLPKECGKAYNEGITKRIVGGQEALLGQFPWIVRIGKKIDKVAVFNCAGTLINKYYVLSAAHCGKLNNIARLGENHVETDRDCDSQICAPDHQDIPIAYFISHEIYNPTTRRNDISIVVLATPAVLNDFVKPICLPRDSLLRKSYLGKSVKVAGWGYTNTSLSIQSNRLMYFVGPVVEAKFCNKIFKIKVNEKQFCAGYEEGEDPCTGDSGGPAIRNEMLDYVERNYLLGIISYGFTDCGKGPAIYTKIVEEMQWILDHIKRG